MVSVRRAVLFVLASSLPLANCMPDLNALSAETGSAGDQGAGASGAGANVGTAGSSAGSAGAGAGLSAGSGGVRADSNGGAAAAGGPQAGSGGASGGAGTGGRAAIGGAGGKAATGGGAGAAGSAGGSGAPSGGAGMGGGAGASGAGTGGGSSCAVPSLGATIYDTFEHADLLGAGFVDTSAAGLVATMNGATGSSAWDAAVGASCLGSLHYSFAFKAYVSATPDEQGTGFFYFGHTDWSSATALHAMVKVSPVNAPITDVRLFVISGSQYFFHSITDASKFKTGAWNDMVLSLTGSDYVATDVSQLGAQVVLDRAGTAGIPTLPPTVSVWLDDVWLQPK